MLDVDGPGLEPSLDVGGRALDRPRGRGVSTSEVEAIDPHLRLHSVTKGVYRVRAGDQSVVVKVVHHGVDGTPDGLWLSGEAVAHRNYWKREWLAFDSGLLADLPGLLRAPATRLTTQHGDDYFIWMSDIGGRNGRTLSVDDYALIAHALGTTQGSYAAGR